MQVWTHVGMDLCRYGTMGYVVGKTSLGGNLRCVMTAQSNLVRTLHVISWGHKDATVPLTWGPLDLLTKTKFLSVTQPSHQPRHVSTYPLS